MFEEERPYLRPLPAEHFRLFRQVTRTVDDAGCVQVDASYYAASPAPLYSEVAVRVFEREVEILGSILMPMRALLKCCFSVITKIMRLLYLGCRTNHT